MPHTLDAVGALGMGYVGCGVGCSTVPTYISPDTERNNDGGEHDEAMTIDHYKGRKEEDDEEEEEEDDEGGGGGRGL